VNLSQALSGARVALGEGGVAEASLEAEILLRHVLGVSRAHLFARLEQTISPEHEEALQSALQRRLNGEPVAYILGHHEFYGLDFIVDRRVLIPRPETELLVEKAIELAGKREMAKIADIGTGSGAIAVSLAVNMPRVTIYAVDISAPALEVAALNCRKHGVTDRIVLLQGNLLEPLPARVDLIIANLPYVKVSDLQAQPDLIYEPPLALNGGGDGFNIIKVLCDRVGEKLQPEGCLLMEIGWGQANSVTALLKKTFPGALMEIYPDLAGIERVVSLCLTPGGKF
jgi:release factor glutamine methyltransferase